MIPRILYPSSIKAAFLAYVSVAHVREASERSLRYSERHLQLLAITGIVALLGYHFIWRSLYPEDYDSLAVRTVGALLCLCLVYANRIPFEFRKYRTVLWMTTTSYVLPFTFALFLVQNAARADVIGDTSIIWPLQYVVALVLFMQLTADGVLATVIFLATSVLALTTVALVPEANWSEIERVFVSPYPFYGFALVVGSLTNRNREVIDQEKLEAVAHVCNSIAHELRTPLLAIKQTARGVRHHLHALVDGYEQALANDLEVTPIRPPHRGLLREALDTIEMETDHSNTIIDMLKTNASEHPLRDREFQRFSASSLVRDGIARFPFSSQADRGRIQLLLDDDFEIVAPRALMLHVMFNLLKNGLYYVSRAGRGNVVIKLVRTRGSDRIVVEDSGEGIEHRHIHHVFDRFFTTTESGQGSGIGLSFCRMVMEELGGTIVCDSEPSGYTRFSVLLAVRSRA